MNEPIITGQKPVIWKLWDATRGRYVLVFDEPNGLFNAVQELIGPPPLPPSEDAASDVLVQNSISLGAGQWAQATTYAFDPLPGAVLSLRGAAFNTATQAWLDRMKEISADLLSEHDIKTSKFST